MLIRLFIHVYVRYHKKIELTSKLAWDLNYWLRYLAHRVAIYI